jgi:hypothetical protein
VDLLLTANDLGVGSGFVHPPHRPVMQCVIAQFVATTEHAVRHGGIRLQPCPDGEHRDGCPGLLDGGEHVGGDAGVAGAMEGQRDGLDIAWAVADLGGAPVRGTRRR